MYNNEPGAQSDPTLGYTFQNDFLALSQAFFTTRNRLHRYFPTRTVGGGD
ncbi:Uncharacterised protein [Salmonella enterica subsp. enterica]|nr:Uncharacterised protein [Salmonella enterica subsp. enterica]